VELGYWLSCEEHAPDTLVRNAVAAEKAGFGFALASDHLHPWVPAQGQAPFVWAVLGAAAHATSRIVLGTGVSSPIHRIHPVLLAQAAATVAAMAPGRFVLGLGEGERINEHVTGKPWPRPGIRRRMIAEAVQIIRPLLAGEDVNHEGEFFTVEHAQLYTRPASLPDIWLAVAGPRTARLAAEQCDGMIGLMPQAAPCRPSRPRAAEGSRSSVSSMSAWPTRWATPWPPHENGGHTRHCPAPCCPSCRALSTSQRPSNCSATANFGTPSSAATHPRQ
jgi:coenzyme F420-dependent glucose-6-phosphate dehydrogenase